MVAKLSESDATYALDLVRRICDEAGPGLPGSSRERQRAGIIKDELELHLGRDNVSSEEFLFAPGAFLGSYAVSGLFMLFATLLNIYTGHFTGFSPLVTSVTSIILSLLVPFPFIFEFVLGYEFLDPLFRKKKSVNVTGTLRNPDAGNVKRLLIISGHHDSAPENRWLRLLGYGFFVLLASFFVGYILVLVLNIIQLTGIITGNIDRVHAATPGIVLTAWPVMPAIIFALFFTRKGKDGGIVPGAADNLSACAISVAMCRFLVKNPSYIPSDTEIRFISFGGEEAGYRGSRRYVARHLEELKGMDARMLNIETVACREFTLLTSDINGTVRNSPEMVKNVITAAERAGVTFRTRPATLGTANDSGPFSQAGFKAMTLLGFKIPQQMVSFYHQKWDQPGILTTESLSDVQRLALEWILIEGKLTGYSSL
jgi:hypothetical protein